jgi:hypothetical protein
VFVCVLPLLVVMLLKCVAKAYSSFVSGKFLPCWFNLATGLLCPGCGGTRSFYALLRGNVWDSIQYNAFVPSMLLLGVVLYCRLFLNVVLGKSITVLPKDDNWVYALLVVFLGYFILRNIV